MSFTKALLTAVLILTCSSLILSLPVSITFADYPSLTQRLTSADYADYDRPHAVGYRHARRALSLSDLPFHDASLSAKISTGDYADYDRPHAMGYRNLNRFTPWSRFPRRHSRELLHLSERPLDALRSVPTAPDSSGQGLPRQHGFVEVWP